MKFLKRFIRWTIIIVCGLYMCLQVAMHVSFTQELAGKAVASVLKKAWDWDISIGRIQLGLWNRIIIDDICLKDKHDSTMLHASRLAAKLDILPLADGRVNIANAQLFGTQINLYQQRPDTKPNFQFLIDTFSSNDSTEGSGTDIHIGSLLLRRVNVRWEQQWKERKDSGTLDPAHLFLKDIAVTAHLRTLTQDSINLSLKRLSFLEQSGLKIDNISFNLAAGRHKGKIQDLEVNLPNSHLNIPSLVASCNPQSTDIHLNKCRMKDVSWATELRSTITPSDIKAIVPALANAHSPIYFSTTIIGSKGSINIPRLNISGVNKDLDMDMAVFIQDFTEEPQVTLDIKKLQLNADVQYYITREFLGKEQELSPIVTRLKSVGITGRIWASKSHQMCNLNISNHTGDIQLNAQRWDNNDFKASIDIPKLETSKLLSDNNSSPLEEISIEADIHGTLKDKYGKPELLANISLPYFSVDGKLFKDGKITGHWIQECLSVETDIKDLGGTLSARMTWDRKHYHVEGDIQMDRFQTERLGLEKKFAGKCVSINADVDATAKTLDDLEGSINIKDFCMSNTNGDTVFVEPFDITISTFFNTPQRKVNIDSKALRLNASGQFKFSTLAHTVQNALHMQLPDLIPKKNIGKDTNDLLFDITVQDTVLIRYLANKNVRIPMCASIHGEIYGAKLLKLHADIPQLFIGNEHLRNSVLDIDGSQRMLNAKIITEREQKLGFVTLNLQATASDNRLRTILGFDNNRLPKMQGEADITTLFSRLNSGELNINTWIAPSNIIVSDTLWRIHPTTINFCNKTISIDNLRISQSPQRGVNVSGRLSESVEDSLVLRLQHINVEYIMDLVNFHSVDFSGYATGNAVACKLFSQPEALANIRVEDFRFNNAPLGTLQADAAWGDEPHMLQLDARISDPSNKHLSRIAGGFNIGDKSREDGLDLEINTKRFNLAFINKFTEDIFDNIQGRTSGYCRLFGPFNAIDIEGEMMIDNMQLTLPMLGTTYYARHDSVHITPGHFSVHATLHDSPAINAGRTTDNKEHTALLDGVLNHDKFKNLSYDFDVNARNFLAYDQKEFGESSFFATCFVSGDIGIRGIPGRLTVDVNATPEAGTTFNYNVSTPATLTESNFITFFDTDSIKRHKVTDATQNDRSDIASSSDVFLNFNLQITPDANMKLLMDPKSGDMIELQGNGRIMAKYHNKGRFNIYGTYRIHDGQYRLSLQEIIRKDFRFKPNGTITFGGDALKAGLNLKAVYSVPGVSLDDLTSRSLGFSKTKVDCIMNLTGTAEYPAVAFDFDLPNATEDERQMVRSIVSTEEERNMQAIYLLGLGRFYNVNANSADQSSAAINSLVSSTLSSSINQFISNAVGNSKWTFGANLKTGDDGWRNMDVEGMIGGSLFDDRLRLSGNFGYREKYYTQRNFISDVTVEYLLTKNGSISVKAYNQANDRYFVQSSMNTQGIGLLFKKDFNRFSELFLWLHPKTRKK